LDVGWIIGLVIALVSLWALLVLLLWLLRPRGVSLREVMRVVPDVLRLLGSTVTDRRVPWDVRLVVGGIFVWIASPIDLIPEFIPGIGPVDDVVVAILALRYIRRRLGTDGLRDRWGGSPDGFRLLERVIGSSATNHS
jgi:uncharacterized membrane protein YkvA (DUF1232 family)